jgi:hypothetical protein
LEAKFSNNTTRKINSCKPLGRVALAWHLNQRDSINLQPTRVLYITFEMTLTYVAFRAKKKE